MVMAAILSRSLVQRVLENLSAWLLRVEAVEELLLLVVVLRVDMMLSMLMLLMVLRRGMMVLHAVEQSLMLFRCQLGVVRLLLLLLLVMLLLLSRVFMAKDARLYFDVT